MTGVQTCALPIYYYLKHDKRQESYDFIFRNLSRDVDAKVDEILEYNNGWNAIRDEYLKLKNANRDNNKHSFSLYLEAVNNVYNRLPDDDYDDDDEDDDYYD